jgi:hypothetical protein
MIKETAMFSAHTIHVLMRNTLIFFIVLFVSLFFWLKSGIEIDVLKLGRYKVEGLYLKLGKRFTLKAQNIVIPKSKKKTSLKNIEKSFEKAKYFFTFFDSIDIDNVQFNDNHLNIIFRQEVIYIANDDYELAAQIERKDKIYLVDVPMLVLKKENITLNGQLQYDLDKDLVATKGEFDAYGINGRFTVIKKKDDIAFKVSSDSFTNLRPLIKRSKLSANIQAWILDKIKAKHYTVKTLSAKGKIEDGSFKMDVDSLKAKMLLKDVKMHYHKDLDPIDVQSIILIYEDNTLFFDLKEPKYRGRDMSGSKLSIRGLGTKMTVLDLDLKIYTKIDDTLHEILRSYKVKIPIKHVGKPVNIALKMNIPLTKSVKKKESNLIVDVELSKGGLSIDKTVFPVLGGKVHYEKNMLTLKDVHIKEKWYEGVLHGKVNLKEKNADLIFEVKDINIGKKKKFLVLRDISLPFRLDYSNEFKIDIPSLNLSMHNKKDEFEIYIQDLKKIQPYIINSTIRALDGGSLRVRSRDFSNYAFSGYVQKRECVFYTKGKCHVTVPIHGKVTANSMEVYAFDKRLYFSSTNRYLKLNNLNIDIKKLLDSQKKEKERNKNVPNQKTKESLVVLGKNGNFRYDTHSLNTDSYDIEVKPNGDVKATGALDGDIVKFSKKGNNIFIKALRVKDKLLHPLIDFRGLQGGRYSVEMYGNPEDEMYGTIIIEGGMMRDFQAYNNTLALINVLPAIATLSNPGFSENGFSIEEGVIEYRIKGNTLTFDSIYIKGTSSTVVGKGTIHLKYKILDLQLAIKTARELGKIVGSIPLVGDILLGKEKSLTIGLTIKGDMDKPKVETSVAKDILNLPLMLIKRTLDTSINVFNPKKLKK